MPEMTPAELAEAIDDLAQVLGGLKTTADDLVVEMAAVRADSAEQRKVSRRARLYAGVAAAAAALVLIIVSTGFLLARMGEREQAGRDAQTARVLEAIEDCTRPGDRHDCYNENQARTSQRLAPIISIICDAVPPERRHPPCPTP